MRLVPAKLVLLIALAGVPPIRSGHVPAGPLPAGATSRLGDGTEAVGSLAVAPDGAAVAVARGSAVGLFRLTGVELRTLSGHSRPVRHLAYAPRDELLVSAAETGDAGPLRLWDPATGELLHRWGDATRTVRDLAFSADGQTLAVLEPNAVTLHNPRLGRFGGSLPLPEGASECHRLALSPDGRTLVTGGERERIVWDLPARQLVRCSPATGPCRGLHFLPDGRQLVWLDPADLSIWSLRGDDTTAFSAGRYLPKVTALALSPDARLLALAQGTDLSVWDVSERRLVKRLDGHRAAVRALAFTPDGLSLIAGDDAGTALVWKVGE